MTPQRAAKTAEYRRPLSVRKKQFTLAVLLRNPHAFQRVHEHLTPEHLARWHDGYALLWWAATEFYQEHGELADRPILEAGFSQLIEDDPDRLSEAEIDDVQALLASAFDDAYFSKGDVQGQTYTNLATTNVRLFLEELQLAQIRAQLDVDPTTMPVGLSPLLAGWQQQIEQVETLTARPPSDQMFPDGWDSEPKPILRSTGNRVLDWFLGGGHMEGEVNVFMGPYASCKTLLTTECVDNSALQCQTLLARRRTLRGLHPVCVYASYETPTREMRLRVLAHLAEIPLDRLIAIKSFKELRGPGTKLWKYEQDQFKDLIDGQTESAVKSERERVAIATELVNQHILFLDLSRSDPHKKEAQTGGGGVTELSAVLQDYLNRHEGRYFHVIWIDHVKAMMDEMSGRFKDQREEYAMMARLPKLIDRQIAERFNTPVWVIHQLSGEANSRPPTATMHHTDAAACKQLATYADHVVVCGTQTPNALCVWRMTKHRRRPPQGEIVVWINGRYGRVENMSRHWVIDHGRRSIVARYEVTASGRGKTPPPEIENTGKIVVDWDTPTVMPLPEAQTPKGRRAQAVGTDDADVVQGKVQAAPLLLVKKKKNNPPPLPDKQATPAADAKHGKQGKQAKAKAKATGSDSDV